MAAFDENDITYEQGKYQPTDVSDAPEGDEGKHPTAAELQE